MLNGIKDETEIVDKALEVTNGATCARIAHEIQVMKAKDFLFHYPVIIGKEGTPKEDPARFSFRIGNLFKGLQYVFDKLSQLSSGTPLSGVFKNLSKLFGWSSGAFGSRA